MAVRDLGPSPQEPDKPHLVAPQEHARWRRITAWFAGILLAIAVLGLIAATVLLHSASFHNYLLSRIEHQASASLNTSVQLQNFSLHPSTLGLDLYGLTIYGAGPGASKPLLQVDHIGLGVRVISLLHRQWNFSTVAIDRPVLHFIVSSSGDNNLPTLQSSANSNANIFDLKIGHVLLDRGEVYYNDRKSPLEASLRDLQIQSDYDAAANGRYFGNLSYRDGWLHYANYSSIGHDLQAQFDARRDGITLSNVVLKSGESQILLDASLRNYTSPTIQSKYVLTLATADIRHLLNDPSLPLGIVVVNGTAQYANIPGRPALDTTALEGTLSSKLLRVSNPTLKADVRDLGASFTLANGSAEIKDIRARLLGGSLTGVLTVRDLSGKQEGHLTATMHNLSLADLKGLTGAQSLTPVNISGRANAQADATWNGAFDGLVARADASANGTIGSSQQIQATSALPIEAHVRGRYAGVTKELSLDRSYIRAPQTSITANGTIGRRSALQVHAASNDLHEVETVAAIFSKPSQALDLHGSAAFNGTVQGSLAAPQIAGLLNASNLQVRGTALRVIRTNLEASPSLLKLQGGYLEMAQQGRANFTVQTDLHDWSYTTASQFMLNVSASQLSVSEIARAVGQSLPVTGTLNANISAHGTQLNPIGQGDLSLRNATAFQEPIHSAELRFQGTGDAVHANLTARITAGTAQGEVTYLPKQQGYTATLEATNIHLEQVQALKDRDIQAAGTLNLSASGHGTLQDPQGQLSLTIPQLDLQKQQIRNINLQANVANRNATFVLASQVLNNPLHAQGKVSLSGDYYAEAGLDTPVMPLQPLLAAYSPAQAANLSGQTELHATLRGPLKNMSLLEAHINVPTLAVAYRTTAISGGRPGSLEIAAVGPIQADYADGVVTLQPGEIKGTGTDIRFQGRLPVKSDAPSTLKVQGSVDLTLAQAFDPTLATSGQVQIDVNSSGRTIGEDLAGQVRIVNASFSTPDMPVGVSNGNGVLTVRGSRLDITQLTANVWGGQVSASGAITYRPHVQFNIGLKGNGLQLLYPQTVRSQFDLNLAMAGTTDSAVLQGQINVNRLSFTPDFDLSSFANQFNGISTPPPTQGFADNLKLNIALRSTSQLNAVSPALSLEGDANLRVIGTAANPVIVGRASLSNGDLIFLGNRYVLQSGTIVFANTMETQPVINLQATTTVQQYNIGLRFHGPLDRLKTNYTSDPALPPADIIHLLAFGTTEEAANAAPTTSPMLGAESLLASQVTSQITNRVQKVAGISQLSVDPQLSNNGNQQPGARITVQQRVTSKLFVTFTTDVTTSEDTAVQMQYQVNRKWSVSGVRDWSRGFGIDGRYHKDF